KERRFSRNHRLDDFRDQSADNVVAEPRDQVGNGRELVAQSDGMESRLHQVILSRFENDGTSLEQEPCQEIVVGGGNGGISHGPSSRGGRSPARSRTTAAPCRRCRPWRRSPAFPTRCCWLRPAPGSVPLRRRWPAILANHPFPCP